MALSRIRAVYVQADGALWKLNRAAMEEIADGAYWADVSRQLRGPEYNHRTERWSRLPAALYAYEGDPRVSSSAVGIEVIEGEAMDEHEARYFLSRM